MFSLVNSIQLSFLVAALFFSDLKVSSYAFLFSPMSGFIYRRFELYESQGGIVFPLIKIPFQPTRLPFNRTADVTSTEENATERHFMRKVLEVETRSKKSYNVYNKNAINVGSSFQDKKMSKGNRYALVSQITKYVDAGQFTEILSLFKDIKENILNKSNSGPSDLLPVGRSEKQLFYEPLSAR